MTKTLSYRLQIPQKVTPKVSAVSLSWREETSTPILRPPFYCECFGLLPKVAAAKLSVRTRPGLPFDIKLQGKRLDGSNVTKSEFYSIQLLAPANQ